MTVEEVWMSTDARRKSRYGICTLGGIVGIAALALGLILGGTVLGFTMGWPMEAFSAILFVGVTGLIAVQAVSLRRHAQGERTVFFQTEKDRLFVLDAARLVDYGGSLLSFVEGTLKIQEYLQTLAQRPDLPARAEEILRVESIRERAAHYVLACQVCSSDQRVVRRTYRLVKGIAGQKSLLRQLEQKAK